MPNSCDEGPEPRPLQSPQMQLYVKCKIIYRYVARYNFFLLEMRKG